jgi:predicted acyltransferase
LYEHTRDPEGLLSTLPSLSTALFGLLAGLWLRTGHSISRKMLSLAIAGVLALCAGLAWSYSFPINKKLWTSSFVLFAAGWSLLCLAATACIVDLWRLGRSEPHGGRQDSASHPLIYKPALVFGTNAILAYMISELGDSIARTVQLSGTSLKTATYRVISAGFPNPAWSSLIYSFTFVLVCWLLVLPFYRKRLFLRI